MQTFQGYDALLQASPVFYDIAPEEIHAMLDCLSAKTLSYPKGSSFTTATIWILSVLW